MPIFEYQCEDCGAEFELLVRSDTRLACPTCESTHLEKQLSVFATEKSGAGAAPAMDFGSPCGSCGHPDGPGACHLQ
ncbi:MAG: zinc ribbon domain-containing protein [Rubrivivax sp.]|jgi:putative FmdB family regulatory protein|nr:zinc ribbon domain-containing protein [Rubrivivax sp.]